MEMNPAYILGGLFAIFIICLVIYARSLSVGERSDEQTDELE